MLFEALKVLSQELNQHLRSRFRLNEDIVLLSPVKDEDRVFISNRVSISLIGLDRESANGNRYKNVSASVAANTALPWQVSMNVLLSVVFQEKQYEESLHIFSAIVAFVQKNNVLHVPSSGNSFSIEPINLSVNELSNLWSICGENYYPSLFCKLRMLTVDENEVIDLSYLVSQPGTDAQLKKE